MGQCADNRTVLHQTCLIRTGKKNVYINKGSKCIWCNSLIKGKRWWLTVIIVVHVDLLRLYKFSDFLTQLCWWVCPIYHPAGRCGPSSCWLNDMITVQVWQGWLQQKASLRPHPHVLFLLLLLSHEAEDTSPCPLHSNKIWPDNFSFQLPHKSSNFTQQFTRGATMDKLKLSNQLSAKKKKKKGLSRCWQPAFCHTRFSVLSLF